MLVQTCLLQADCHKRETALRGKSFDEGCQGAASAAQAACAMFCLVGNRHFITRTAQRASKAPTAPADSQGGIIVRS